MKRALLLLLLIILCASFSLAEGEHILVTPTENGIDIQAQVDVLETYIFVNDELVKDYQSLDSQEDKSIRIDRSVTNEIEIRYVKEYSYVWDNYDITENEDIIELGYFKYDKDDKAVKFSLYSDKIIHPDIIGVQKRSVDESFSDYDITLDEEYTLNCYPKITTGENLYFKCKTAQYPHIVSIKARLGTTQNMTLEPSIVNTVEEEIEMPPMPPQQDAEDGGQETEAGNGEAEEEVVEAEKVLVEEDDQDNISAPEETEVLDNITMTDTILEGEGMSNAVKFLTLMLFLALGVLFFVASHHKHENKKAGVHHPHKKKRSKK